MKTLLATLILTSTFSATSFATPFDYDIDQNADCIIKKGAISCNSGGYLSGNNYTNCTQQIRYRMPDGTAKSVTLTKSSSNRTNTGAFAIITLGISDAVVNQVNAASAMTGARKQIALATEMFDMCNGAASTSTSSNSNSSDDSSDLYRN